MPQPSAHIDDDWPEPKLQAVAFVDKFLREAQEREETRSAENAIQQAYWDREALDTLARCLDRYLVGSHAELIVNEMAISIRAVRPQCREMGCIRTKGHGGAHWGRPSCGHRGCMDSDGHIDECLEDRQESLIP